jgi:hypothetical protein
MHTATFPASIATPRPASQPLHERLFAALSQAWHEHAARRRAWQHRDAVAHLQEHLLKDIGADDQFLAYASARRLREDLRLIEMQHGAGRFY